MLCVIMLRVMMLCVMIHAEPARDVYLAYRDRGDGLHEHQWKRDIGVGCPNEQNR